MAKVVAFFNHKGGVGKTTILFNVAIALAQVGKKVVLFDADSQANLTALAVTEAHYQKALDDEITIWSALEPLVTGAGDFKPMEPLMLRSNLWLVPGDIRLADFEGICPTGWTEALAGEARGFRVTTALYRLFHETANRKNADFVLVDLGPNVNALNRSALIASDGFIIPLAADLFSVRALPSVGNSIAGWVRQWRTALSNKPKTVTFALPSCESAPIPLGYVSQQFSVFSGSLTEAFQRWQDKIPYAYQEGVIRPLKAADLPVDEQGISPLIALKYLSALVPKAQQAHKAIFELSGAEARGAHFKRSKDTRDTFLKLAEIIIEVLGSPHDYLP
jgi:cellulose biosynthesis protein BcsQ